MSSDETSCSDCRLEIIQIRWTRLLLNWINKCVQVNKRSEEIDMKALALIIKEYKEDISMDSKDKELLTSENFGQFIKYKFARLKNLSENKDMTKKLYVMASILLFYCCVNSQSGKVETDIYSHMSAEEQEMIVKFCEVLSECEVTVNNIDIAIEEACSISKSMKIIKKKYRDVRRNRAKTTSKLDSYDSMDSRKMDMYDSMDSRNNSNVNEGKKKVTIQEMGHELPVIQFRSSVTVFPSVLTDTSSHSKSSLGRSNVSEVNVVTEMTKTKKIEENEVIASNSTDVAVNIMESLESTRQVSGDQNESGCQPECACTRCSTTGPCCGKVASVVVECKQKPKILARLTEIKKLPVERMQTWSVNWKVYLMVLIGITLAILLIITVYKIPKKPHGQVAVRRRSDETAKFYPNWAWECKKSICQKVFQSSSNISLYSSLARCTLLCMGPQLWPIPIGYTAFSKTLVALTTNKLEYIFQAIQSETVHRYLAEAFKLFINDLNKLEKENTKPKNRTDDLTLMKMYIQLNVLGDVDPRLRTDTDEMYNLRLESKPHQLQIKITAPSFCGIRHGLETLSQLILLDQISGYLITVSSAIIKDSPSYSYRGLMIDTGRNFIAVPNLLKTIDGMAASKLNTFHWRISDVTSFPFQISKLSVLSEFGAYDRSMVYTREDIKSVVDRAGIRGIRVLIEVALPGPVGRPWSWSPQATCSRKNDDHNCDNVLCLRLMMNNSLFDVLETIYSEILDLTKVNDIFHLSGGVFSISNCFHLLDDREGFLDKALARLKFTNGGFMPSLPIIWYNDFLNRNSEAKTWNRFGVQLNEWNSDLPMHSLSNFKVIHSAKWDLSCQMKNKQCVKYRSWQEMYSWKSWHNLDVFTIEGGEAVLWTDLVDSGNIDYHLWPRAAAVAERLWSDVVANSSVTPSVYTRLDAHRWRLLLRGLDVQPIWPGRCSFDPGTCLDKIY